MTAESTDPGRPRLPRVVLESVAIVLSILLAFAIDAGWDERQERRAEHEILEALESEFEFFGERFSRSATFYTRTGNLITWLLDEAEFDPGEITRLDSAMLAFVGAPTMDLGSGTHAELVASGRLALISDPALRERVSTWQGLLEETTDNEVVVRQYVVSVMVPFLAARHAPIARISRVPYSSVWRLSVTDEADAIATYRELLRDPEFRALAAWRYEWALGSARSYERARVAADSALTMVRSGLAR
jgi:hypothetical protein